MSIDKSRTKKMAALMYHRPAEWRFHKIICLAWPFDEGLWGEDLLPAQQECIGLVEALKDEKVLILVPSLDEEKKLKKRLSVRTKIIPYADIWLRDTLPVFVEDTEGKAVAVIGNFNGWGNKYLFVDDNDLASRMADDLAVKKLKASIVFEGGALEFDGKKTLLTTEECLLNDNRNPNTSKRTIEKEMQRLFGVEKTIWLKRGLANDHTDGHVDTLVRFIAPHHVVIMEPRSSSDPNYDALREIKETLMSSTDADGHRFKITSLPSPGVVKDRCGQLMPASYVNFIIGDKIIVVPTYGSPMDDEAIAILKESTSRNVVGRSAKAILSGGGAFHCMSQEIFG